jgi:hypothetical protein
MQYLPQENETVEYRATIEGTETVQTYCNPSLDYEFQIGLPDQVSPGETKIVTLTPREFITQATSAHRLLPNGGREPITE